MMKKLLFIACIAFCMAASAAEPEIGTIIAAKDEPPTKSDITVSYDYDGKGKLVLSIQNISMNAAARGVTGSVVVKDGNILIQAKERYDSRGPVESLRWYSVQYVIQNVQPGRYSLVHDDSAAEGTDRIAKTELDLTTAGKGAKTATFKDPDRSKDPFAEPLKKLNKS
jgi:hypothetical protein